MNRPFSARHAFLQIAAILLLACIATAGGPPTREVASPEARRLSGKNASEYWDLTAELQDDWYITARFQITNQGPGKLYGTAVGHVYTPNGKVVKFQNGRLQRGWTLSKDGLVLDVGKSDLELRPPRYKLKINKPDARIRLSFAPNALYRLPKKVTGKNYRVDLLALGAAATGSIRLEGMAEPLPVSGRVTLTHTIARDAETDLSVRRTEFFYQPSTPPSAQPGAQSDEQANPLESSKSAEKAMYLASFLTPAGKRTRWLATLEPGCDPTLIPLRSGASAHKPGTVVQIQTQSSDETCLRNLASNAEFDLAARDAKNRPAKSRGKKSYRIPPAFDLEGTGATGQIELSDEILQYEPLDDLPGPIRWIAGLSAKPRRVWFKADLDVTIPPGLSRTPTQFQGQGVATVSFLNPVAAP